MKKFTKHFRGSMQLATVIFGGLLIGLPVLQSTAQAQQQPVSRPQSKVNPCPSIFYENPHNNQVAVPQGCPPNAFTNRLNAQGTTSNTNSSVGTTPTQDQRQLGVGGEAPYSNSGSSSTYNQSQRTTVPNPQPLNYPNSGIPNSQFDSRGNRINGPAGGYTNLRESSQNNSDSRYDNRQSNTTSDSTTNSGIPNSQIDRTTGNRVNGPAGGYTNLRQSVQNDSGTQYNRQSSTMRQQTNSNSATNSNIPNSQIDSTTGNRVNGPAGGYSNQRLSSPDAQSSNRYQNAIATVTPTAGRVTIRLVNQTNAPIVYQAIGDTQLRTLGGRSEVMLQGLQVPTTVTFYRQDRGLLMVTPQRSNEDGMLEVSLQETTDFAMDKTALRIENNGAVYLN